MTNDPKSPFSAAGQMTEEARKAMNNAIDAFSKWRDDVAQQSDKNSKAVFQQMADAAKAIGWPAEFVDMTRHQMQNATQMQLQFMDQVMDMWEQQMRNPGSPPQFPEAWQDAMKKFTANIPGMSGGFSQMPGMNFPGFQNMPNFSAGMTGNPFQFWMQAADMWQKSVEQGMKAFMDAQNNMMGRK